MRREFLIAAFRMFVGACCLLAGRAAVCRAADDSPTTLDIPRFGIEIEALLGKSGCNLGSCHGNATGKGGLKLTLRSQDAQHDYRVLVEEHLGRRVDTIEPDRSLILAKPTMGTAHEGGQRFKSDSPEADLLRRWIAAGAPFDPPNTPRVTGIEVQPQDVVLHDPERSVQFRVTAKFSDGTERDVTRWACYDPAEPRVTIDLDGRATFVQPGETTILVRYLQAQRPIRVALVPERADFAWSAPAEANFIDAHVHRRLQTLRIEPSADANDEEFLRRVSLDLLGVLPTLEETRSFLSDAAPDKRAKLIDAWLERPEYAEYQALRWADLLREEEKNLDLKGVRTLHEWLRASFAANKPLDTFARELVTGLGSTYANPAANYYRSLRDAPTRGEATAQVFLGMRLQCAKCHNHPFDRWTQDDYHDWTSVFARIDYDILQNARKDKNDTHEFIGEQVVKLLDQGEVKNPRTGKDAIPRLLGVSTKLPDEGSRLERLGDWMVGKDNRQFARAMANRLWHSLMGRGIVEPVDDFRAANPPTHPELLEALTDALIAGGYDQRAVLRMILNSKTYQRSSRANASNRDDVVHYARTIPRRLAAEPLLDALTQATGARLEWSNGPDGTRAVQRPEVGGKKRRDPGTSIDKFLRSFGKPPRLTNCECERSTAGTIAQSFQMLGGPLPHELLTQPDNRLRDWANSEQGTTELLDEIWLTFLTRRPTDEERGVARKLLEEAPHRRTALEDLVWALVNSQEFQLRR